jgi:hypothetical protein
MDETQRRRLSTVRELNACAALIPRLLAKIDEVVKLPHITEPEAVDAEWIAERTERLLLGIREALNAGDCDRLIASVDRLREEIADGNAKLDRLLRPETPH